MYTNELRAVFSESGSYINYQILNGKIVFQTFSLKGYHEFLPFTHITQLIYKIFV